MIKIKNHYWNIKIFAENMFIFIFCSLFIYCLIGYIKILSTNIGLY